VVGIILPRRKQFKPDVVWNILGKVIQSNVRFRFTDHLEVHLYNVSMPYGKGRVKTKVESLDVMTVIKGSIVVVTQAFKCLAYAIIVAMARVIRDPKFVSFRHGRGLKQPVEYMLKGFVFYIANGVHFEELRRFQKYLSNYRTIVFHDLNPDRNMFNGNSCTKYYTKHCCT